MPGRFNYVQPVNISVEAATVKKVTPGQKTQEVKVFLVVVGDDGYSGKRIGCSDSLVAVPRTINKTVTPLNAALVVLLAMPHETKRAMPKEPLGNYVLGPDLKLSSVSIRKGTATIRFSGAISVAGICDEPRITEQINATAMQFPTVKRVKVFVGNKTLEDAIS
jgi:spore germination protein GerM